MVSMSALSATRSTTIGMTLRSAAISTPVYISPYNLETLRKMYDANYEWVDISSLGDPGPVYTRGMCLHKHTVPVDGIYGDIYAELCMVCDRVVRDYI